jgi:hypothetical protein
MRRLRRQKRLLGWLAAMALMSNVLAIASIVRPTAAVTVLDDILGPVALCTPDGARSLPGGPQPHEHAPADHCPACATLAKFALAAAVILAAFILPAPAGGGPAPSWQCPRPFRLGLGGISPRAPPVPA